MFQRELAVVFLIAWLSLGAQVTLLIGSHGLLPVHGWLAMIRAHANDLRRYNGIAFDVGTLDTEDMLIDTQAYSEALTRAGIPHRFDVFAGGHLDRVKARLQAVVLPYVSQKLAAPGPQGASAQ